MAVEADKAIDRYLPNPQTVSSEGVTVFCGDLPVPMQNRDAVENYNHRDYIAVLPQNTRIVEAKLVFRHKDSAVTQAYANPAVNMGCALKVDTGEGEGSNPKLSSTLDLDPATVAEGDQGLYNRTGGIKAGRTHIRWQSVAPADQTVEPRDMWLYLLWTIFEQANSLTDVLESERWLVAYQVECQIERPTGIPMEGNFDVT